MANISLAAGSTRVFFNATSANIDTSGLQIGDWAFVTISKNTTGAVTPPAGWTAFATNGTNRVCPFVKRMAVAGDITATNSFTFGSARGVIDGTYIRGAATAAPSAGTHQANAHVTSVDWASIGSVPAGSISIAYEEAADASVNQFGVSTNVPTNYTDNFGSDVQYGIGAVYSVRTNYRIGVSGTVQSPTTAITDTSGDYLYDSYHITFAPNSAPTSTTTGPSGTVSTTNQPNVTWTYSDADGDAQTHYWVKVFALADTTLPGFDPETFTPVWSSGDVTSAATSAQVGIPLSATSFKAYTKVRDAFNSFGTVWSAGPTFTITASGLDKPGRVFFVPTNGSGTTGPGFYEFDSDSKRVGQFTWQSAPLRGPNGRTVEIREVQVYARSYDTGATLAVTVNGVTKTQTVGDNGVPGRDQLSFLFREHAEVLDVTIVSTAGTPSTNEAPTIQAVRIGWRPLHMAR